MSREELGVASLFSGSRGNCTFIKAGDRAFLIDAGGSLKAIETALREIGSSLTEISAVFVTHEHSDHIQSLPLLSKRFGIPVHMTAASAGAMRLPPDSPLASCLVLHDGEFSLSFDSETTVEAFFTPHDSAQCVGYRIRYRDRAVGIATDLGCVTQRVYDMLRGCLAVVLESNHDPDMVKNGPYTPALKRRILSSFGHLSNGDCAEAAAALARAGTRAFLLAHLSKENNTPETALRTVGESVGAYGVSVRAAAPDRITVLL